MKNKSVLIAWELGMEASVSPSEIDLLQRTIMETIASAEIRKNADLFAQKYAEQPSEDLGKLVADWVVPNVERNSFR